MNYLSLCSGVEAASVAWKKLGWNPVAFSEIEKFPSEVLQHQYPNVPNLGDMTNFKEWNFDRTIDLVVGGTPCQSFSVAGLRKGMEDPRGNLALTFCAILNKFRPKWFVWENVPGVLSSNKGRDFGSFLGAVAELGYGFSYRVLDAQNFGVPQRRRRVFVVGHLGAWEPTAEVLFESESLQWHPKKSRPTRQDSPGYIEGGFGAYNHSDVGGTIKASGGVLSGGSETFIHVADKAPTITSSAAGFSRPGNDTTADSQYIGTAYNITFCDANGTRKDRPKGGLYINETNVSNTLTKAGVGTNVVDSTAYSVREDAQRNNMSVTELDKSNCISAHQPSVMSHHAQTFVADKPHIFKIRSGCEGGGKGYLGQDEKTYTISTTQDQHLYQHPRVRRLTPIECERLQGFPDNYTNIKDNCPDGPRYKAMGNSMAVPVMRWIGERINRRTE
jgi:DNA (cytosine-5)-methyltransferase 1